MKNSLNHKIVLTDVNNKKKNHSWRDQKIVSTDIDCKNSHRHRAKARLNWCWTKNIVSWHQPKNSYDQHWKKNLADINRKKHQPKSIINRRWLKNSNNIGEITGNKLKIGGWIVCRILNTGCPRRIKQIFSEDQYGHPMIDKIEFLKQFFK